MEIKKGGQTLIGFPALIDGGDAVTIEVFDEPEVAAAKHRAGLRRLFALQIKDALKYLEKNIPDLQKMAVAYMPLGTQEELRAQIIDVALDRAFLLDPLPTDEAAFKRRVDEGRGRLTLIANEVARLAGTILTEYAAAARKIKDTKNAPETPRPTRAQQLQRLMPKRFIAPPPGRSCSTFPLPQGHHPAPGQVPRRPRPRRRQAGRAAPARAALLAPGGRAQGRGGRPHARAALAAGRAARELLRAGAAHAAAGVSVKRLELVRPWGLRWPKDQISGRAPTCRTNGLSDGIRPSLWIRMILPWWLSSVCASSLRT
jgi:hypothetical protein